jgi:hypothetical protein
VQYGSKEPGEQCVVAGINLHPRTPFAGRVSFAIVTYLMRTANEHDCTIHPH